MKTLTPGDKSAIILPTKPKVNSQIEYAFKPKTNVGQKSVSSFGLYERGLQKKQEISKKIEKNREIKAECEMKECKFIPNITNTKNVKNNHSVNIAVKSFDGS